MNSLQELRLGILGLSEGNGHPYSWAAIFNGYDPAVMASCPFPNISAYLAEQSFPEAAVQGARVTHVWAQDRGIAEHIAAASLIPTVVDKYEAMIGEVDAVLLARDDAENHLEMSKPFLEAGLPIYIDKPVALTMKDLDALYGHESYRGQIFSCSALRFSQDLKQMAEALDRLGQVRHVQATVPKKWENYGVHVVEPVVNMINLYGVECEIQSMRLGDAHVVAVRWPTVSATFTCLGALAADIRIRLFGTNGGAELVFTDTYLSFKRTLECFVNGVRSRQEMIPRSHVYSIVSILERGMIHGE